ncbi:MAG: TetR/AcrR family transcriptional regulator [Thermodesulfobacteriota bacterium]
MKSQEPAKTEKGQDSRKRILEATWQLIAQSGSGNITLDQIAAACNISKSSILWHFGSKEALFLEVANSIFQDFEEIFIESCPPDLSPAERFGFFLHNYKEMLDKHFEAPKIFFYLLFKHDPSGNLQRKIQEIYEWNRKAFCEQFNLTDNQAVIVLGMLNGIIIQSLVHPEGININDVFDEVACYVQNILQESK